MKMSKKAMLKAVVLLLIAATLLFVIFSLKPTYADPDGGLSGWGYRKIITINSSKVDENLTDFPVLVKLTSSNFDFGGNINTC